MIIDIDNKTRIRGTEMCWQLEKTKIVRGKVEWRPFKYFTQMDKALREAAQREIRTDPAHGFNQAIVACNRITEKYARLFDDVGKTPKDAK